MWAVASLEAYFIHLLTKSARQEVVQDFTWWEPG